MSSLREALGRLFGGDGPMPRGAAGAWAARIGREHVIGDAMALLACAAIAAMIWRLGRRGGASAPLRGLARASACFVGLCGLGHLLGVAAPLRPAVGLAGLVPLAAGVASWWAAWAMVRAWPALTALASPAVLERQAAERGEALARALEELSRVDAERARLASVVESSSDAIIGMGLDGIVGSWNGGAERLYGYTPAEAVGRPITFLIPRDRLGEEASILEKLGRGERVDPFDSVRLTRSGGAIDVTLTVLPIRDPAGRIVGISKIARDISARRRAEEASRTGDRIYRAIGESIPFGTWICDAEGRNLYASESFLRLVGLTQEQCSQFGWGDVLHPDDAETTIEAWKECVRVEGNWEIEHRFRGTDGAYHPVLARGVPVRDGEGKVIRWAGINLDIGRLRRAEDALRASEERQRLALLAARLAHWEWDIGRDLITHQDSLSLLYGRPDDRPFACLDDYLAIVHPDDRDSVRDAAARAIATCGPYEVEYRIVRPDGSVRWLGSLGATFSGPDGAPARMVGVNLDITARKDAEAQILRLNESLERRVRERTIELKQRDRLIEQAHDAILVRSRDGIIASWNRGAERLYGWSREEAVGRASHDLLKTRFPRPLAEIREEFERVGSWDGEMSHERRDGARISVRSRWVLDRDGAEEGVILEINFDITERKAAEQALRRSEAALREAQRLARVGSWEWDPEADAVTWSEELYRIAGRDPSRPAPTYAEHAKLYTPETFALYRAAVSAALESGEPYEIELEMIGEDGVNRWIIARGQAARDAGGKVVRLHGTGQDITEQRAQREELRRARDAAMAATRAKSEFLAAMSHEIRTPMNGVIGMAELILGTPLDGLQREYAETIRSSGEALLTVINDILDFAKIEAGKLSIESVEFDPRGLIEGVADLLSPRARQKGITLVRRVAPGVPPALRGDPVRIRQVLTNLAGNAVKFTDRGEVSLEAEADAADAAEGKLALRIRVRDTGIGIPEDRRDDIFESFTQVRTEEGPGRGGTGLGLAICRNLVGLMGGTIGFESIPGEGSTFWFELPLGVGAAAGRRDADRPAADGRGAGAPLNLRILLAEDNAVNRRVAIGMAERLGCRVDAVEDGRQALEALDYGRHDLVLMDVQMPVMDGLAAATAIRGRERDGGGRRHIPIIAMTAHAMRGDREQCLAAGMDAYLTKPVRPGPLREALAAWAAGGEDPPDESPSGATAVRAAASFRPESLRESCGDDPDLIREIIALFLDGTPRNLDRLEAAVAGCDGPRVAREAHAMVGALLTVGAGDLAATCRELISLGDRGDIRGAEQAFRSLRDRLEQLNDELSSYLGSLTASA